MQNNVAVFKPEPQVRHSCIPNAIVVQELESTQPLTSATHPEISPLLFVGKIMAADSATVYGDEAEDQKEVHQIAIMSNSAS